MLDTWSDRIGHGQTSFGLRSRRRGRGGGPAPVVPAVITINSIGPQEASGDVPNEVSATGTTTAEVVMFAAAEADPAASDFDGGGEPTYIDLGPVTLTPGGDDVNLAIPDDLDGSYKFAFLPANGGDGDVAVSAAVTIDTTAPAYDSSVPADEATDVAADSTIAITFDENVVAGSGTFIVYDVTGDAAFETFTVGGSGDNGGTISIATDTVTLTPGADMEAGNDYSVRWTAGAVTDAFSNPVAANAGDTLLNFLTAASADAMGGDAGKLYWYGYDDTTRSGTDVTSLNDKGGNAFALTGTGSGSAPTQADASSPLVFNSATPNLIQTATSGAGNRLVQDHLSGGGSIRLFGVVDAGTLAVGALSILFSESLSNTSGHSILFSISEDGGTGNISAYISASNGSSAFTGNVVSSIPATGLVIYEVSVTQTTWQIWINGTSIGSGSVTAANFPTAGIWTTVGARASNASASLPFTGDFYELFVTGTTDGTTLGDIRSQLATKYSITL